WRSWSMARWPATSTPLILAVFLTTWRALSSTCWVMRSSSRYLVSCCVCRWVADMPFGFRRIDMPGDIEPALGRIGEAFQGLAIDGVDGDALSGGDDAHDAVARQGVATSRKVDRHVRDQPCHGD